jgi:DMSO reductase family type II enzyme chaperone
MKGETPTLQIDSLTRTEARQAAARSRFYKLLAEGFEFPSADLHASLRGGDYARALESAAQALPYRVVLPLEALQAPDDHAELEAEYIRLFDVGLRGRPPCPLYEGEHRGGARMQVMEELVRFYEHFGLALSVEQRELPDHLTVELEFLHYLTFREAAALEAGRDAGSYRRAQKDFLERHPCQWLPRWYAKLVEERAGRPFAALGAIGADLARRDLAHLAALAPSP